LSKTVAAALASAEAVGYRIDVLLDASEAEVIGESPKPAQKKKPRKKRARKPRK
jgi:hypothetical protein